MYQIPLELMKYILEKNTAVSISPIKDIYEKMINRKSRAEKNNYSKVYHRNKNDHMSKQNDYILRHNELLKTNNEEKIILRYEKSEREKTLEKEISCESGKWLDSIKINDDDKKKIEREIKLTLNKLTYDNFDGILPDIKNIIIKNIISVKMLSDAIINKAMVEHKYTGLYAKLCEELCKLEIEKNVEIKNHKSKNNIFKKSLMEKLQSIFENDENFIKTNKINTEDISHIDEIKKKKISGLMKFIAELAIKKVLSNKIIQYCTMSIFEKFFKEYIEKNNNKTNNDTYEIILEMLILLYENVGMIVDDKKEIETIDENIANIMLKPTLHLNISEILKKYENIKIWEIFMILEMIRLYGNISDRMKLLIKNLQDKKKNKWAVMNVIKNDKPLKIEELHEIYHNEKYNEKYNDKHNEKYNDKYNEKYNDKYNNKYIDKYNDNYNERHHEIYYYEKKQ